ncbi:MAG: S-methyl-5'-thioadenosine phosphorylase [Acidimicrobiia bacterium]|nr:S-methyl-5'-thioadenosine phosphorylase [Acidimicrobiia bacterium]
MIGVLGGSGLTALLEPVDVVAVDTPFGPPSASVTISTVGDRRVAFLPRHGAGHRIAPHRVNYRANLWALREVGVTGVLAPFAAGSLSPVIDPGDLVVVDQLVDRTRGRADTYFDDFADGPHHASFADPYDPDLRAGLLEAAAEGPLKVHDHGTVVVIQGPRFSTRAESVWFASQGWSVVNMTQYPEAVLARELDLPYAGIALITDRDTGTEDGSVAPVSQEEVFAAFEHNLEHLRGVLLRVAAAA